MLFVYVPKLVPSRAEHGAQRDSDCETWKQALALSLCSAFAADASRGVLLQSLEGAVTWEVEGGVRRLFLAFRKIKR